jgi:Mg-chelatase subunit ChlD
MGVQRLLLSAVFLCAATTAAARVTFVSPLEGSQVIGPQAIEVTTDASGVDRVDFSVDGVLAGVARKAPYRIAYDFGTSLASRTITARVWSAGFRTSEVTSIMTAALTANDSIDIDLVEVPVRVRASRMLKASDLRLTENGVVQSVRDVRRERPPAHFVFVVDRSLSMGDGKLDAALRAIRAQLRQLRPGDTSSLVLFNHHVERPRNAAVVADVPPSGGTSLRDALASVGSRERTYAIVITDGGDRNSVLTDEEALRRISGTRTVVNAIVLGPSHARVLDLAAEKTGGRVVRASKGTIADELQRILEDINSRYLVIYQSRGTRRGWRTIEVKSSRVDVLSARKGYFAE